MYFREKAFLEVSSERRRVILRHATVLKKGERKTPRRRRRTGTWGERQACSRVFRGRGFQCTVDTGFEYASNTAYSKSESRIAKLLQAYLVKVECRHFVPRDGVLLTRKRVQELKLAGAGGEDDAGTALAGHHAAHGIGHMFGSFRAHGDLVSLHIDYKRRRSLVGACTL